MKCTMRYDNPIARYGRLVTVDGLAVYVRVHGSLAIKMQLNAELAPNLEYRCYSDFEHTHTVIVSAI